MTATDLAQTLGISYDSTKKLLQQLRDTIECSSGALLVTRRAAQNGCPQLAASLSGWDEHFRVLMRKRIVRHIESCSTCAEYRGTVVNARRHARRRGARQGCPSHTPVHCSVMKTAIAAKRRAR